MKEMPPLETEHPLSGDEVRAAARACGFPLVGIARAEALDRAPLERWLAARSVLALAIPYHRAGAERAPIARYARGRDYHYAHRDRMKALRKRLLKLDPTVETYAAVDTGVAMEKVWAERAGLG